MKSEACQTEVLRLGGGVEIPKLPEGLVGDDHHALALDVFCPHDLPGWIWRLLAPRRDPLGLQQQVQLTRKSPATR